MKLIDLLPKDAVKKGNRFFLTKNLMPESTYGGIFLGSIEGRDFIPSLQLLELQSKNMNSIIVSKKAAWLFSCQRDILQKGVISVETKTKEKSYIVKTEKNEVIGIAEERGAVFTPIFDCGHYLRREFTR